MNENVGGGDPRLSAIVTGGGSGIGEAIARALAADDIMVTVADVDLEGATRVADAIRGDVWHVDLTDTAVLDNLTLTADIVVNNAGVQTVSPIESFPPDQFRRMTRLMVEAPFLLARASIPHMYERGFGRIINVSSVHGLRASKYKAAYVASKHALEGLSKVIALEGAPHGVTSNCVNPGYVRTPLVEKQLADLASAHGVSEEKVLQDVLLEHLPIQQLIEPADVAEVVSWLASSSASMVTGVSWAMDGGWSAR
jgi:3-hydroxybutyrate dehydrogenase